jgi:hypothetical protein
MFNFHIFLNNTFLIKNNINFFNLIISNNISKRFFIKKILILLNNIFLNIIFLNKKWIFLKYLSYDFLINLKKLKLLIFSLIFLNIRLFKSHGINMRLIYKKKKIRTNVLFMRLGYSHGFLLKLPISFFFRIFKRRYLLIAGFDINFLNNFSYYLRFFRYFFDYKLIGLKFIRDIFKLKIGKKKTF